MYAKLGSTVLMVFVELVIQIQNIMEMIVSAIMDTMEIEIYAKNATKLVELAQGHF